MPDDDEPQPFTTSRHYDEFHNRAEAYKRAGGDLPLVWASLDDLGQQISNVRHDVKDLRQNSENLDAKLFGWRAEHVPEFAEGGLFGAVTRQIDNQTQELKTNQKLIARIAWAILVAVIAAIVQAIFNSHGIHWP